MASRSEDPRLIIVVISFELTQHIHPRYVNVTEGQTDGQRDGRTTYDSNTALRIRCIARQKYVGKIKYVKIRVLCLKNKILKTVFWPTVLSVAPLAHCVVCLSVCLSVCRL